MFWGRSQRKSATSPATSPSPSPEKRRSKGLFDKAKNKSAAEEDHPLNWYLQSGQSSTMSASTASPRDSLNGGVPVSAPSDKMENTPAPEMEAPVPASENGHDHEHRPTPPPHRTKSSPPPPPEIRPDEAEAFKAAGNKFYKAGQYGKAIDEYTKGRLMPAHPHSLHFG